MPRTVKQTTRAVRTKISPSTPKITADAMITDMEAMAANVVRLTFSTRVQVSRLPKFTAGADGTVAVESVSQPCDTQCDLTFEDDVAGTNMHVEKGDPGLRTPPGGFVPAGTYAIPTFS